MADDGDTLSFLRCLEDRSEVTDPILIDLVGVTWLVIQPPAHPLRGDLDRDVEPVQL